jgi:exopolysaccharide production protein ExoQ
MSTVILKPGHARHEIQRAARPVEQSLTWVLVLPFLFFIVHGTFSFQSAGTAVGGFSPGGTATHDPGVLGYLFAVVTYLMVAWLINTKLKGVFSLAMHFKMLTLLALLAAFSFVWSQSPAKSLLYGILYLISTLFGYYLVIRFEPEELMTIMSRLGLLVAVLGLLVVVFLPRFGLTHGDVRNGVGWQGIFTDRTGAAKSLVYLISPAFVSQSRRRGLSWLFSVLLMGLMIVMAHAVTAIFVLFIYLGFLFVLRISRKVDSRLLTMTVVTGGIVGVLAVFLGIEYGGEVLKAFGRNPTLTGRTAIWSALAISIAKRPILGYGFFAFWQGIKGESAKVIYLTHWTFGYAHNGIIEIFLQLGTTGVVVFFITLFKAIKDGWYCFRNDHAGTYDWYLGLLVITIFYNIDEATVVWPNDLLSILYVVICCGLAMGAKRLQKEKAHGSAHRMHVVSHAFDRSQASFGGSAGGLQRSVENVRHGLLYFIRPLWGASIRPLTSYIFGLSYKKHKYEQLHQELLL